MDMPGIADKKSASFPEPISDTMMDAVGREPVDAIDLEFERLDHLLRDVGKGQRLGAIGSLIADGADEPGACSRLHREHHQEVGLVEIDVHFTIHRRAAAPNIGHVEDLPIGSAWEIGANNIAHGGTGTITASDKERLAHLRRAVCSPIARAHMRPVIGEFEQLGVPLDRDAKRREAFDEQPLMLVLRKHLEIGIGRQPFADRTPLDTRFRFAPDPDVDRRRPVSLRHDRIGEVKLTV
jgi:hypothetical protein